MTQNAAASATHGTPPPRRPTGRRYWPWVQAALTIAMLAWVLGRHDLLGGMTQTLGRAHAGWFLAGIGCAGVWIGSAAYRWQFFLRVQGLRESVGRLTAVYLIAQFFSLVLPGAVGSDAVRVLYLWRRHPHRKLAILFSVMLDHLAGMLAVMAVTLAVLDLRRDWLAQFPLLEQATRGLALFWGAITVSIVLGVVAVKLRWMRYIPRHIFFRRRILQCGITFGKAVRRWRQSLAGILVSVITLASYFGTFYCAGRAVDSGVSLIDMFSLMPLVDAFSSLPLTMSGLGVREKLFEMLLHDIAGVPAGVAILTSLGGFACSALWGLAGAAIFLVYRPASTARQVGATQSQSLRETIRQARQV